MSKLAKTLSWILPFAALAAGVAGYFLLPDTLVMQIGLNGQPSNLLPKLWGLLIPLALTLLGAIWSRARRTFRHFRFAWSGKFFCHILQRLPT